MPVILVVDDSPMDQALIGQLLKDEPLDWIVDFAQSAEEALVRLRQLAVDVVVTDMMMPGMDGLELLDFVRQQHPRVPVILTTGQGNESLAAEALRAGAANYVPKNELADRLGETIKQVLQVAKSERNYDELIESVAELQFRFELKSDPSLIAPLVALVQQLALRVKLCGQEGCRQLGVALDEALMNAMYHGNLELPRDQLSEVRRRLRDGQAVELIEARRMKAPYHARRVFVSAAFTPDRVEISIRDEGSGFDPEAAGIPQETRELESLAGASDQPIETVANSHRGLVLIRSLMDVIRFNDRANEITMIKRREEEPAELKPLPV